MTITRADVERMLSDLLPGQDILAELCRCWLAVDDAPIGETMAGRRYGTTFRTQTIIPAGTYKLVCIDTPTGGREG